MEANSSLYEQHLGPCFVLRGWPLTSFISLKANKSCYEWLGCVVWYNYGNIIDMRKKQSERAIVTILWLLFINKAVGNVFSFDQTFGPRALFFDKLKGQWQTGITIPCSCEVFIIPWMAHVEMSVSSIVSDFTTWISLLLYFLFLFRQTT